MEAAEGTRRVGRHMHNALPYSPPSPVVTGIGHQPCLPCLLSGVVEASKQHDLLAPQDHAVAAA